MSKSDPVCVLYKQEAGGWREVGRTEQVKLNLTFLSNFEFLIYFSSPQIKNNLNPSWQKKFTVDHPSPDGRATNLRFEVYDWDSKSNKLKAHDFLARLEVRGTGFRTYKSYYSTVNVAATVAAIAITASSLPPPPAAAAATTTTTTATAVAGAATAAVVAAATTTAGARTSETTCRILDLRPFPMLFFSR